MQYELTYVDSELNVSDSIMQNIQGIELIEFVLRRSYQDVPESIKQEIHAYLKEYEQTGLMKQRDGYILIR